MTPGEGDLSFGVDTYRELTADLPVLAGNLTCGDATWPLTRTVDKGGRTVGFIGVVSEKPKGCELSDPAAAVTQGLAEVQDADVVVLLSHGVASKDKDLVQPGVDFVVNGHSRQSYDSPRELGAAWQLGAGSRGKMLGVVELVFLDDGSGWVDDHRTVALQEDREKLQGRLDVALQQVADAGTVEEKERLGTRVAYYEGEIARVDVEIEAARTAGGGTSHRFTNQLVDLDAKYDGHAATDALVDATKDAITALEAPADQASAAPDGPFLGSESCRGCHQAEYAQWKGTGHASAYDTLAAEKRHLDSDCVSCHTTGYGMGGPDAPTNVGHLKDVGCESCHGPGQEHLADPAKGKIMNPPAKAVCTGCHDGDQDGGRFVYEDYVPKVTHTP